VTATVGALTLPLPAGTADTVLADPLLDGMLDYFAFWLNLDLNTKLANMTGQPDEAVPAENRHPFNPDRTLARLPRPALYMWRHETPPQIREFSVHQDAILSTVDGLYVFTDLSIPRGANVLAGLGASVIASVAVATQEEAHASYGYSGAPNGTPVTQSLNVEGWDFQGGTYGHMWRVPGDSTIGRGRGSGADGAIQSAIPAVMLRWQVLELVGSAANPSPLNDSVLQIRPEGIDDADVVLERVLEFDDDTELEPPL
jgi:hypothetical protein